MSVLLLTAAGCAAAGYWVGRVRLGSRLDRWAHAAARRGRRSPGWWLAQPVFAVELGWMWTVRPRRTLANVRAWREPDHREPAPVVRDLTRRAS